MQRRAVFNRLSLDLPAGWEDNSMVALTGPSRAPLKTMGAKQAESPRPNWVLRRIASVTEQIDLAAFVSSQEELAGRMGLELRPVERHEVTIGEGEQQIRALVCDYTLHAAAAVLRQVNTYFQAGDTLYVASGTGALDDGFTGLRETFLGILRSLRVEAN
jgi:hypothetical protein